MAMVNIPVEPPVTDYLYRKAAHYHIPLSASMELTPVCNMACRMCYVRMTKEEQEFIQPLYNAEDWIKLGRVLKEKGTLYLLLTGGEPFLRKDFKDIFQELHKMGFLISINTNGTLIDEETVSWLKDTPPVRINMTLYGVSDETYNRLCNHPTGFTRVDKAINLLKDAGVTVKLNCSVTPYNACDLEGMVEYAKRKGLIIQPTSYMFPPVRRNESMVGVNDRFTPEKAAYYAAKIESLLNGEEAFLEKVKNSTIPSMPSELDDCEEIEGDIIRCRAGKCSFWITWQGTLLPCGMMPTSHATNVFHDGFDSAWKSAIESSAAIRLPFKCMECQVKEQCKACAAMVYTESGCFNKVPEYRCQMTAHYPQACLQVAKEIEAKRMSL